MSAPDRKPSPDSNPPARGSGRKRLSQVSTAYQSWASLSGAKGAGAKGASAKGAAEKEAGAESLPPPAEQPMERLFGIARAMMRIHDRAELLEYVSDHLRELFDAQNSYVVLFDEKGVPRMQVAHQEAEQDVAWPVSTTIIERVRSLRDPIVIDNTAEHPDLRDRQSVEMLKIVSVLCTPLVVDDEVVGILQFDHRGESHPFPVGDLRILSLFADQVATAFKNLELIEQLGQALKETREAQDRVVQTERLAALGEMAGGIAHDFNNTLFIALGLCEVALAQENLDEKVRHSLTRVHTCAEDAAQTVKRLQIFARGVPAGTEREAVSLSEVAAEAEEWTRRKWEEEAGASGAIITFKTVLGETGFSWAQPSEVREIVHNLIFNAVDAMKASGTITVTSGRVGRPSEGAFSFLEVRDEGVGMDEATKMRVFEPFFTTKGPRGHGLGLSASWTIARQLGGRIEVESKQGIGTAFTLFLPTLESVPEPTAAQGSKAEVGARILIVDDDQEVLETIGLLAKAAALECVLVSSGDEALALLETERFDAMVTDYVMPEMNGVQLAQRVAAVAPELPILILTGRGAHLTEEELSATGCRSLAVIGKPIGLRQLSSSLAEIMAKN